MRASRDFTSVINFILDELCPPILRECWPLMYPIYRAAYGKDTARLMRYKDHYAYLSDEDYGGYYECAGRTGISQRPTDLDRPGVRFVLENARGTCLDAGCGRGWLAKRLAEEGHRVTGLDIASPPAYAPSDGYAFVQGSLDGLPFPDDSFDTVICAHVLEHVRYFDRALAELLRTARERVVIVLPRQREYRYTADLHIRYFPYLYNIQTAFPMKEAAMGRVGRDWGIIISKKTEGSSGRGCGAGFQEGECPP